MGAVKRAPRGVRCGICRDLVAATKDSMFLATSKPLSVMQLCAECSDDVKAFIQTLLREFAAAKRPRRRGGSTGPRPRRRSRATSADAGTA